MDFIKYYESLDLIYDTTSMKALQKLDIAIYNEDGTKREKFDILCELANIFKGLSSPEYDILKTYTCRCLVGIRYKNKLKFILDII